MHYWRALFGLLGVFSVGMAQAGQQEFGWHTLKPMPPGNIGTFVFRVYDMPARVMPSLAVQEYRLHDGQHCAGVRVGKPAGVVDTVEPLIWLFWRVPCDGGAEQTLDVGVTSGSGTPVKALQITQNPAGVTFRLKWYDPWEKRWHTRDVTAPVPWAGATGLTVASNVPAPPEGSWKAVSTVLPYPGGKWTWIGPSGLGYMWDAQWGPTFWRIHGND